MQRKKGQIRKEDDKKYTARKQAQPTYTNIYMHLMDETPKIEEKLTEQRKIEEATKKQKKEKRDIKTISDRIPVGVPKIYGIVTTAISQADDTALTSHSLNDVQNILNLALDLYERNHLTLCKDKLQGTDPPSMAAMAAAPKGKI